MGNDPDGCIALGGFVGHNDETTGAQETTAGAARPSGGVSPSPVIQGGTIPGPGGPLAVAREPLVTALRAVNEAGL